MQKRNDAVARQPRAASKHEVRVSLATPGIPPVHNHFNRRTMMEEDAPFLREIPKALGEIIRRNRHLLEIGLATDPESTAVTGDVDSRGQLRGRIDSWRVIAIRDRVVPETTLHVLGHFHDARAWLTSPIAVLTADRSLVRTRNSLYELGSPAQGEPDITLLLHTAYALREWGLDRRYDLGVIAVFY